MTLSIYIHLKGSEYTTHECIKINNCLVGVLQYWKSFSIIKIPENSFTFGTIWEIKVKEENQDLQILYHIIFRNALK
jgi:hypothetical protein